MAPITIGIPCSRLDALPPFQPLSLLHRECCLSMTAVSCVGVSVSFGNL